MNRAERSHSLPEYKNYTEVKLTAQEFIILPGHYHRVKDIAPAWVAESIAREVLINGTVYLVIDVGRMTTWIEGNLKINKIEKVRLHLVTIVMLLLTEATDVSVSTQSKPGIVEKIIAVLQPDQVKQKVDSVEKIVALFEVEVRQVPHLLFYLNDLDDDVKIVAQECLTQVEAEEMAILLERTHSGELPQAIEDFDHRFQTEVINLSQRYEYYGHRIKLANQVVESLTGQPEWEEYGAIVEQRMDLAQSVTKMKDFLPSDEQALAIFDQISQRLALFHRLINQLLEQGTAISSAEVITQLKKILGAIDSQES